MNKQDIRIKKLLEILRQKGMIHVKEWSEISNVSEMTVRRDVVANPKILRLQGGTISLIKNENHNLKEYLLAIEDKRNIDLKQQISAYAASLIQENDTVFLDCGSTITCMLDYLDPDLKFTAACNSINIFLKLKNFKNCEILMCSGKFHHENMVFEEVNEYSILNYIRFNKSFISAAGVDLEAGVTCCQSYESNAKIKAMKNSKKNILIVDSSKFQQVQISYFAQISEFDTIITDENIEPDILQQYQDLNISLEIV